MKLLALYRNPTFVINLRESLSDLSFQPSIFENSDFDAAQRMLRQEPDVDLVLISTCLVKNAGSIRQVEHIRQYTQAPVLLIADSESQASIREAVMSGSECYISKSPAGQALLKALISGLVKRISESTDDCLMTQPASGNGIENSTDQNMRLTPRQVEVLSLVKQGKSNKEIARDLDLAEGTVKIHCMAIFRELGVSNRTQAAMIADDTFPLSAQIA